LRPRYGRVRVLAVEVVVGARPAAKGLVAPVVTWLRRLLGWRRTVVMTVRADEVLVGDLIATWHAPDGPRTPVVDVTIYPHRDGVDVVYLATRHDSGSPCTTIRDAHDLVTIERRVP